jgi:hypothetical protein
VSFRLEPSIFLIPRLKNPIFSKNRIFLIPRLKNPIFSKNRIFLIPTLKKNLCIRECAPAWEPSSDAPASSGMCSYLFFIPTATFFQPDSISQAPFFLVPPRLGGMAFWTRQRHGHSTLARRYCIPTLARGNERKNVRGTHPTLAEIFYRSLYNVPTVFSHL